MHSELFAMTLAQFVHQAWKLYHSQFGCAIFGSDRTRRYSRKLSCKSNLIAIHCCPALSLSEIVLMCSASVCNWQGGLMHVSTSMSASYPTSLSQEHFVRSLSRQHMEIALHTSLLQRHPKTALRTSAEDGTRLHIPSLLTPV